LKARRWILMTTHVVVCALALGAMLLLGGIADPGGETIRGVPFYPLVIAGALVIVAGLTLMWLMWWRCPDCRSFLGQVFSIQRCPACGRPL
jgi:prepilin signal peptidase PulO-like enzyme (type II secretory pathway)